jgi:hypothetical protein
MTCGPAKMEESTGSPQSLTGKSTPVLLQECFRPLGLNLTPFRPANPVVFHLNIADLSRKNTFTTQKEKIQDISEK